MAVVEYRNHVVGPQGQMMCPYFIKEGAHFGDPDDQTQVGWVIDNSEYYVPDTLTTLTKSQLVTRQLDIHSRYPERVYTGSVEEDTVAQAADTDNWRNKTTEEVTSETEAWYDAYTTACASITR